MINGPALATTFKIIFIGSFVIVTCVAWPPLILLWAFALCMYLAGW